MVGLIATTLLAGARMPAGATSNMKRKIPRDAADRIAGDGREQDVRNLAYLPAEGEVLFLDIPFYRTPLETPSAIRTYVASIPSGSKFLIVAEPQRSPP